MKTIDYPDRTEFFFNNKWWLEEPLEATCPECGEVANLVGTGQHHVVFIHLPEGGPDINHYIRTTDLPELHESAVLFPGLGRANIE